MLEAEGGVEKGKEKKAPAFDVIIHLTNHFIIKKKKETFLSVASVYLRMRIVYHHSLGLRRCVHFVECWAWTTYDILGCNHRDVNERKIW